jgi:hypothetical protein
MEQKLALDCKNRWNSVFNMLNTTALPYKAAFERAKKKG